jgi:hypothetical protein
MAAGPAILSTPTVRKRANFPPKSMKYVDKTRISLYYKDLYQHKSGQKTAFFIHNVDKKVDKPFAVWTIRPFRTKMQ